MLNEAAYELHLRELWRLRQEELESNPETPEHLARADSFWNFATERDAETGTYRRGFGQAIWQDGVAAFAEGLGESSCPFRAGAWRRYWLEAYHSAEREP